MPKKKTTKMGAKAKFLRSKPASMPAGKVVEEAAKVGIGISETHVYGVRAATKKAGTGAVRKAVGKVAKAKGNTKTAKAKPKGNLSKTAFVLGFSADTPTAEILAKAKAAKIPLTRRYIYDIRTTANAAKKMKRTKKRKTAPAPKPAVRTTPRTGSLEERFVDLVLDMGLTRAGELLAKLKERVKQLRLV